MTDSLPELDTDPLDVLFVHVGKADDPDTPIELLPMGLPAMADWLVRRGRTVEIIHLALEKGIDPGFDVVAHAARRRVRVACLDLHWHAQTPAVLALAGRLKEGLPGLPIVVGGYTASAFADEILARCAAVDAVVRGDGEIALAALVDVWLDGGPLDDVPNVILRRPGGLWRSARLHVNDAADLAAFRFCVFDTLRHRELYNRAGRMERRPTTGEGEEPGIFYCNCGRGCPYDCVFCGGSRSAQRHIGGRERVAYRPVAAMVDDLARMEGQGLATWYNTFHPSPDDRYFLELFAAIRERGLHIGMIHECLHLPSPELIGAFSQSFGPVRRMDFVLLTGGEALRRRCKPNALDTDGLLDVLEQLARHDIDADLCFLTGLPGESAEDQRESLRFIERARARHPRVRVQAELLAIEPLAPMNVDPAGHGIVSSARGLQDYVDGHGTTGFVGYEPDTQTVEEARSRAAALVRAGRVVPIPCCRLRTGRGDPPLIQLHDISLWDEGPQQGLGIPSLIAHALADERLGDAVRFDHRSWRADLAGEGALDPAEIAAAALDARPAAVGFTMTTWSERPFLEAIRRIRAARPKLPVIVGGPLATCEGTRMMERAPGIDALVAGHGEVPFQAFSRAVADGTDADELSAALSDVGGMVLRCGDGLAGGGVAAVDVLPPDGFPSPYRLGLLDPRQGPSMNVEWSRGCAGRCAYCAWGNGLPRIVPASTDRVRQDVEFARRCGVSRINITDAALNAPGYPLAEVCAALEEASEGSGLGFTGFLRYEFLETGQLAELARVPFARLNVGLQTDDDRALRALGRPAFDGDRFRWAVNELSRIARVGVQIISALPGDTYDAFQRRLYSLLQMECDLTVFPLQAPPGTTLWENREALGIRPDPEREHVVFQTSTLGPRDHLGCLELAQRLTAAADRSAHGLSAGPGVAEGLRVHVANGPPLVQLHQANVDDAGPNFGLGVPFLISHARRQADLEGRYDLQQVPWEVDHPDRFRASVDEMVDAIVADDPLMVGFSLAPWSYVRFLEVIRRLRIRRPELGVVVGGPNACIEGETLLSDVPEIDLLVPGEGELPFAGLLRALAAGGDRLEPARLAAVPGLLTRRGGGTRRGPAIELPGGDLDYCGDPLADGLVHLRPDRGRLNLEWTRGCPNACTYCAWPRENHTLRRFGEERIRRDIDWSRDRGFHELLICDAAINHDDGMLGDLCRILADAGGGMAFSAFLAWPSLTPAQAQILATVPWSRLMIGLQTDDDEGLRALGRRRFDRARFEGAVASLAGISVPYVELMTGVPGDTPDKIRRRVDLALSLGCRVSVFPLLATRGTGIWHTCRELGAEIDPDHQYAVRALPTMSRQEYADAIAAVCALGRSGDEVEVVGYHFLGLGPRAAAVAAEDSDRPTSVGEESSEDRIRVRVERLMVGWSGVAAAADVGEWVPEPRLTTARVADLRGVRIGFVRQGRRIGIDAFDRSLVGEPLTAGGSLAFCPAPGDSDHEAILALCRQLASLEEGAGNG